MHQIKDGTGSGNQAKVDETNRIWTRAIAESPMHEAVLLEDHYLVTSGIVTLGTANKTSIIYLQNDETSDLFIDRIIVTSQKSTNGSEGYFLLSGTKNPTGMTNGTGSSANIRNSNFGSIKTLASTSDIGQDTASTDGGSGIFIGSFAVERTEFMEQRMLLQKGSSIAFEITPPPGSTSMNVAIGINCHLVKD